MGWLSFSYLEQAESSFRNVVRCTVPDTWAGYRVNGGEWYDAGLVMDVEVGCWVNDGC